MRLRSLVSRALIAGATFAGAMTLDVSRAAACGGLACNPAQVFPAGGEVPANQFVLLFSPARDISSDGGIAAPWLSRSAGDARVDVPFDLVRTEQGLTLRPREVLQAGTKLVLETDPHACSASALHAEYTLTAPQAVPAALGPLTVKLVRKTLPVLLENFCIGDIDATYADFTVGVTAETAPLAAAVHYRLMLDGAPARAFVTAQARRGFFWDTSELGGAHARVYASCHAPDEVGSRPEGDITLGVHRAKMIGTFLDGTVRETNEIEFELRCDGAAPQEDGATSDAQVGGSGCALIRADATGWSDAIAAPLLIASAWLPGRRGGERNMRRRRHELA